ncbi:Aste57867_2207 [Aphanomyces stellatus]|uniref:Aste57867_2207 protein n=1 Tax=Aphanomyces stellatus TaxID=120398 RepID=A0A485KBC2_9STRA|nr:hypothetical protein As57867_002202 [Aphanomyces stellatus]VFT79410.1 Aste57867_2207 [Aphanomyces stellatus]
MQEVVLPGGLRQQKVFAPTIPPTPWFDITPKITLFDCALDCVVVDCTTKLPHKLGIFGDWLSRKTVLTCDGAPIAKVLAGDSLLQDEYFVEVAPGVDMALVVLVCMALEEATEDREGEEVVGKAVGEAVVGFLVADAVEDVIEEAEEEDAESDGDDVNDDDD